jgi:hypothetical protein
MTVSTAQFDALVPVPYAQARPQLRTGDILLFHSSGLGSETIEFFTHSLWCHAAFVWCIDEFDRVLLLESVDKFGVRARPMSNLINGCMASPKPYPGKLLVVRHADFPPPPNQVQVGNMTRFALDRIGYPYSMEELADIAGRIAAGLAGQIVPGQLDPRKSFICSEYVAKCYEAMGIQLAPDKEGYIAPGDIANDAKVEAVFAVCPDPAAVTSH